jgi:hypothetical protein
LKTRPFVIPRIIFARLTAELYVRRFWFVLLPWPIFAVGLILLSRDANIVFLALLVRLFQRPTFVTTDANAIYFHGDDGGGMKIDKSRVNATIELHGYLALVIGYMQFAFVPLDAFESPADAEELEGR